MTTHSHCIKHHQPTVYSRRYYILSRFLTVGLYEWYIFDVYLLSNFDLIEKVLDKFFSHTQSMYSYIFATVFFLIFQVYTVLTNIISQQHLIWTRWIYDELVCNTVPLTQTCWSVQQIINKNRFWQQTLILLGLKLKND